MRPSSSVHPRSKLVTKMIQIGRHILTNLPPPLPLRREATDANRIPFRNAVFAFETNFPPNKFITRLNWQTTSNASNLLLARSCRGTGKLIISQSRQLSSLVRSQFDPNKSSSQTKSICRKVCLRPDCHPALSASELLIRIGFRL